LLAGLYDSIDLDIKATDKLLWIVNPWQLALQKVSLNFVTSVIEGGQICSYFVEVMFFIDSGIVPIKIH